jgi:hypothetical protein
VLALCGEEYPVIVRWQPPAPQRGPQAATAEKVRRELWGLRLAWLQAMNDASAYMRFMAAPPNMPYRLMIPAISEVVNAASTVRAMELRLRHEWGLTV